MLGLLLLLPFSFAQSPASYPLGPGDQIVIRALHVPEISDKPLRLDEAGQLQLPLVGKISAKGLRSEQLADLIRSRLDETVRNPQVSVDVMEWKSHSASVLGAVKSPGVYQIQGQKRLLEVLSMAGGIDPEAGSVIRVSRPGPAAPPFVPSSDFSLAELSLESLLEGKNPELNLFIQPQDVVTVARAKLIYVIGEVKRSGGFTLKERESMSVLQALSLAEGLTITAAAGDARILRPNSSGGKDELAVDVKKILTRKASDVPLLPNDVLFVPKSAGRSASFRAMEAAIAMGTGLVIWRR